MPARSPNVLATSSLQLSLSDHLYHYLLHLYHYGIDLRALATENVSNGSEISGYLDYFVIIIIIIFFIFIIMR